MVLVVSLVLLMKLGATWHWGWLPLGLNELLISLQLKELYTLLNENYVEDDDNMFRFDYSPEFLLW